MRGGGRLAFRQKDLAEEDLSSQTVAQWDAVFTELLSRVQRKFREALIGRGLTPASMGAGLPTENVRLCLDGRRHMWRAKARRRDAVYDVGGSGRYDSHRWDTSRILENAGPTCRKDQRITKPGLLADTGLRVGEKTYTIK